MSRLLRTLKPLLRLYRPAGRRFWKHGARIHVEFSPVRSADRLACHDRITQALEALPEVQRVRIVSHLRRVVIDTNTDTPPIERFVEIVDSINESFPAPRDTSPDDRLHHPADDETEDRIEAEALTDLLSVGLGLALQLSDRDPNDIEAELASLVTLFDNTPTLKELISKRVGFLATDVTLGLANSIAQGITGGPASPLLDWFVQQARLREARSQRDLWQRMEPRLFDTPEDPTAPSPGGEAQGVAKAARPADAQRSDTAFMARPERPIPLEEGPIEEYAEGAWQTSLGAFAAGLADTDSLRTSMAPLMAGVPKPALIAREVFAAHTAQRLAQREVLSLRPGRLRRMDRIDAVVLDQRLLRTDRLLMGEIERTADTKRETVREVLRELYDPDHPTRTRRDEHWSLQLAESLERGLSPGIRQRVEALSREGARVLVLSRGGRTRALVQLRPTPSLAARALVRTIGEAEIDLYIVGRDPDAVSLFRPREVWTPEDAVEEIRDLQRAGHTVLACGRGDSAMLPHADLALLMAREDAPLHVPVDLVSFGGLEDAAFVVACCGEARKVSKQGIHLTAMGATIAAGSFSRGIRKAESEHIANAVNLAASVALVAANRAAGRVQAPADAAEEAEIPWHAIPHDDVLLRLHSRDEGLTSTEASERRTERETPPGDLRLFTRAVGAEIANPLTPMLAAGAGVSASVGSPADAAIVGSVIGFNGLFAGWQRFRAERAIQALQASEAIVVRVLRDGESRTLPADELVVGDIIEVRAGELIPADARIIESEWAEVDESALTGESLPTEKSALRAFAASLGDRHSMLFAGTAMATGSAIAVVVATGNDTEAARAVRAVRDSSSSSGVHARLGELMQLTLPTAVTSAALLFTSGLIRREKVEELVKGAVNLAVASVPEGLPLLASTAELAAAERLSERGALVRNPSAMEALGRIDTLCLDKTGTLTTGALRLTGLITAEACDSGTDAAEIITALPESPGDADALDEALLHMLHCARQASPRGSSSSDFAHRTDWAVISACHALDIFRAADLLDELPFRPSRMYQAALVDTQGTRMQVCVKGAPEEVIRRSTRTTQGTLSRQLRDRLIAQAVDLADEGYRVLAVAEGTHGGDTLEDRHVQRLRFLGFLCLADPIRPDSLSALRNLRDAGIRPVMITGDHPSTARRIAEELQLGNGESVLSGPEIDALDDEELAARLERVAIVARAAPAHKVRLVRVFQKMGRTVGMTGDGGNDAPAIRLADAGIALGENATRAARDASDVIVRDGRLETIVHAIAEGRGMWGSVRDATSLLVGGNLGEIGYMVIGGLVEGTPPLGSRQLHLVNLFTDVAPALTIALRRPPHMSDDELLREGPETSLGAQLSEDIAWRGLVTAGSATGAWLLARMINRNERATSTVGLLALVGAQLGQTLTTGGRPDPQLVLSSTLSSAALLGLVMTPGVSGVLGCRPLGPINLSIAFTASMAGTLAANFVPRNLRGHILHLPERSGERIAAWLDQALEEADALDLLREDG